MTTNNQADAPGGERAQDEPKQLVIGGVSASDLPRLVAAVRADASEADHKADSRYGRHVNTSELAAFCHLVLGQIEGEPDHLTDGEVAGLLGKSLLDDQEALCVCGHPHQRYFDSPEDYRHGCKHCGCWAFKLAEPEPPKADEASLSGPRESGSSDVGGNPSGDGSSGPDSPPKADKPTTISDRAYAFVNRINAYVPIHRYDDTERLPTTPDVYDLLADVRELLMEVRNARI